VLATTLAGLVWRMAPLHLPYFLWKYGGSALWAADVYWLLAALLPRLRPAALALLASLVALAVEFSRLIDSPQLQAFRLTLAGRLLLGSIFSPRNILAYWSAIVATALIDRAFTVEKRVGTEEADSSAALRIGKREQATAKEHADSLRE
jgi:hypothetical protein